MITTNVSRRQLTSWQAARLGLKLAEIERELAEKRQQEAGKKYGRGKVPRNIGEAIGQGEALDLAGAAFTCGAVWVTFYPN